VISIDFLKWKADHLELDTQSKRENALIKARTLAGKWNASLANFFHSYVGFINARKQRVEGTDLRL